MYRTFYPATMLLLLAGWSAQSVSAATVLFEDNFNRATSKTVGTPTYGGATWVERNVNANDVAIVTGGFSGAKGDNALRIREGTDFVRELSISTLGYTDIQLSFDWEALGPSETSDLLWVGWRIGGTNQTPNPFQSLAVFGLGDRRPYWHSVLDLALPGAANLASPTDLELQFRIRVDKKNEGAKIDNVVVTGTEIPIVVARSVPPDEPGIDAVSAPEPASLAVWGLLAVGVVATGWRRRST